MTSIYDMETDTALETDGAVLDLGAMGQITVAAWLNPKHQAALARLRKPYKAFDLSGRDLPADVSDRIGIQAMAEAIVLGWTGIKGRDGTDLPFSQANAETLLGDLKTLRGMIVSFATDAANYRRAALAQAAGN